MRNYFCQRSPKSTSLNMLADFCEELDSHPELSKFEGKSGFSVKNGYSECMSEEHLRRICNALSDSAGDGKAGNANSISLKNKLRSLV